MNHHRPMYGPLIVMLTLLLTSAWPAAAQESLKACGHPDYPPWAWRNGNQIVGVCSEITRRIFQAHGITVETLDVGPWARCQKMVENGAVDINMCAHINEPRRRYSMFVDTPVGINEIAIFVKKGTEFPFDNWQDLVGKRTARVLGVSMGQKFDDFQEKNTQLIRVADRLQAFNMLQKERVDFVATNHQLGKIQLQISGLDKEIVPLPSVLIRDNLYISLSKKSPSLTHLDRIEEELKKPEYQALIEQLLIKYSTLYIQEHSAHR